MDSSCMPQAIESTAAAKSAISAPVNAPRRPRALRTARRSIAQAPRCARCSATWSTLGASSVPATRPSASSMTRSAYAAAIGSWVTITTVCPSLSTTSRSRASTPRPFWVSSAPVGSSANTTSGPGNEGPGDRDPLLLAAGQLRGTVAQALLEPDPGGDLTHGRAPRPAAVQAQGQGNVLCDGERRQQVEGLEDEPDPLTPQDRQPPLAEVRQVDTAQGNASGGGPVQPRRHDQECALARARWPHDRGERPPGQCGADAVEGDDRSYAPAMDLADIAEGDRSGD